MPGGFNTEPTAILLWLFLDFWGNRDTVWLRIGGLGHSPNRRWPDRPRAHLSPMSCCKVWVLEDDAGYSGCLADFVSAYQMLDYGIRGAYCGRQTGDNFIDVARIPSSTLACVIQTHEVLFDSLLEDVLSKASNAPRRSLPARQWCNTAPRIPMASTNAVNQAIPHVRRNSLDQENQEAHPKNTHTHNVSYVSHSSFHRHTHNEVILQFIDMPFPPFGCRPGMSQRICCATACSVPIQDGPLGPCGLVGTMR